MVEHLSDITDRSAVQRAIDEYRSAGREAFLERYGLAPSRDYFISYDGELIDSKPVLSVAYGYQYPEHGPLSVAKFNGGLGGAVPALKRLGFSTVTPAQLRPPEPGDEYKNRTEIYEQYGGDKVAGIIRLPGDEVVNVFSDAEGPYADAPPSLTEPFGYRGEGLNGPQRLDVGGNAYLENARLSRSPVRFLVQAARRAVHLRDVGCSARPYVGVGDRSGQGPKA